MGTGRKRAVEGYSTNYELLLEVIEVPFDKFKHWPLENSGGNTALKPQNVDAIATAVQSECTLALAIRRHPFAGDPGIATAVQSECTLAHVFPDENGNCAIHYNCNRCTE